MKWADCLTYDDKLQWHIEVYAWRRVWLGVGPEERTSPPDPDGRWFDGELVDEAERKLRWKLGAQRRTRSIPPAQAAE